MSEMFELIEIIERIRENTLPDALFIKETVKLFEAIIYQSNSLLKSDVFFIIFFF